MCSSRLNWDKNLIRQSLDKVYECRAQVQPFLTLLLNEYHRKDNSYQYYDLILGDWLDTFLQLAYVAWLEHKLNSPGGSIHSLTIPLPSNPEDFKRLHLNYDAALQNHLAWATSAICDGEKPQKSWFAKESTLISTNLDSNWTITKALCEGICTNKPKLIITAAYWKCTKIEKLYALWKWRSWARFDDMQYPITIATHININWRIHASSNFRSISGFQDLVCALLPLYLPVVFLEGFNLYREKALNLSLHRPKAMFSANALYENLIFKLYAAEWQKEGTKLLYGQHGGGYGINHSHIIEEYETRVSSCFYSWGWERDDRLVKPLAPPLPRISKNKTIKILLILVSYPKYIYRIHYHSMGSQIPLLHNEVCEFLHNLSDHKQMMIRGYPYDYGWGETSKIRNAAPEAMFDIKRPSPFIRFAQSQLVVHSYLCTSYLETLALNIPTVCFYNPIVNSFDAKAQPLINELEHNSILHRSGKDAARFVSSISENPLNWWFKANVQEARSNFVRHYANFSEHWLQEWEEEFKFQIQA